MKKLVYEDQTRRIYSTENEEQLLFEFLEALSFNGEASPKMIKGISTINASISSYLQSYLEGFHICTHLIRNRSEMEILIKNAKSIPLKIVVSNTTNESHKNRFGIDVDKELPQPVVEYFWMNTEQSNPLINGSLAVALSLLKPDELKMVERLTKKANAVLKSFFSRRNIKLLGFDIEFGLYKKGIIVTSNFSLENLRLLDLDTDTRYDMAFFQQKDEEIIVDLEKLQQKVLGENQEEF